MSFGASAAAGGLEQRFWVKLRRNFARLPFLEDLVAAYFCAFDPLTPPRVRAILLAALAYFVLPADLIPDYIIGFGFVDDGAVLTAAVAAVGAHLRPIHREAARAFLGRLQR